MGDPVLPRNDRGKAGPHRDIGRGFTYHHLPSLPARPAMRARASPERSHLRPGQPVPGSCPVTPSAAAGLAVPPAITLQSLRRRHRRQFCSPQPWATRGPAVYDDDDISHPALASAISPSRPGPTSLRLASSASNQVAPLFFSECSGSTTSEAGPTGGPACRAMPPGGMLNRPTPRRLPLAAVPSQLAWPLLLVYLC